MRRKKILNIIDTLTEQQKQKANDYYKNFNNGYFVALTELKTMLQNKKIIF